MAVVPPYAHKVNRVTISGTAFNGAEEWSTGFYLGKDDGDANDPEGLAELVAGPWQTLWNGGGSTMFPSTYRTLQVKVSQMLTSGATDLDAIDYYTYPSAIAGGGSAIFPAQITLAVTMTSQIQRGLASKGRMYLPSTTFGVDSATGKLTSGTMTAIGNTMKTFFDSINTLTSDYLILASHGHGVKTGGVITSYTGALNAEVTGCRIGDVYDTQRRRRDDLIETYTARTLA
jgi:hypothetical protein